MMSQTMANRWSCNTLLLLLFTLAAGCRTATSFTCGAQSVAHAPPNFGSVVDAHERSVRIYRGGQPTDCSELAFLKALGVKSILKLNDRRAPIDLAEERDASALGLHVQSFDFSAHSIGTAPTCDRVREALAFLRDDANGPVYVHCTVGRDRTGYVIGMYEKEVLHRTTTAVMSELHAYGHEGLAAAAFAQIDRELQRDVPECSTALH
jgi:protein tyrosine phosphatase (PTP) superfamily phosphohydrolase (DUF442 family)